VRQRGSGLPLVLLLASASVCVGVSPASAQEVGEPERHAELGWDDGPTYRFSVPEDWPGRGREIEGRIGGSLYLDAGHVAGDLPDEGWDAVVRRARIYTGGWLSGIVRTEYKFEFAFESTRFLLNDFYLRWRPRRFADTLTVGYMDPPFGLQTLVASSTRSLMEVASPAAAFSPGFRLGVEAAGTRPDPDLSWFANLSTIGQRQETGEASNTPIRGTARLVWRPWGTEPGLLHLGLDLSGTLGGDVRFRSQPESFLASYVVDTDDIDGRSGVLGLEGAWSRGPLSVQAEADYATVDSSEEGGRLAFGGAYVQGTWIVTGERRDYDRQRAIFRRVEPAMPFHPLRGGRGALELAARLSWLDLSDGRVHGGRMLASTLGATWTWNRWVRVQAGYVFADVDDRPDASFAHIVQTRLEIRL
jgi:phosphate-selective porin OprO/OprP